MTRKNPLNTIRPVTVDHKNLDLLKKFITPTGRIKSRRYTGVTSAQQRSIARAVKRARHLALLPFISQ